MKNKKIKPRKKSPRGFSLIEVTVAMFVLSVAILGSFTLIQRSLVSTSKTRFRLVAAYLAQEGIEVVRNIRDANWLERHQTGAPINWDRNLAEGGYYNFDYRSQAIPDNSNCLGKNYLKFDGSFYRCSSDPKAQFQRKVIIQKIDLNGDGKEDMKVTVQVSWQDRGKPYNLEAQENLYNWF